MSETVTLLFCDIDYARSCADFFMLFGAISLDGIVELLEGFLKGIDDSRCFLLAFKENLDDE